MHIIFLQKHFWFHYIILFVVNIFLCFIFCQEQNSSILDYLDDHYLSSSDAAFVELVKEDLNQFLQDYTCSTKSVLLFPPVSSYHRFLIHRTAQGYSELHSFSVGAGHSRRTIVCLKQDLKSDLQDCPELMSSQCPPSTRGRGRGRHGERGSPSPSGFGRLDQKQNDVREPEKSPSQEGPRIERRTQSSRTRNKRPEVQLYVPRGRRQQQEADQSKTNENAASTESAYRGFRRSVNDPRTTEGKNDNGDTFHSKEGDNSKDSVPAVDNSCWQENSENLNQNTSDLSHQHCTRPSDRIEPKQRKLGRGSSTRKVRPKNEVYVPPGRRTRDSTETVNHVSDAREQFDNVTTGRSEMDPECDNSLCSKHSEAKKSRLNARQSASANEEHCEDNYCNDTVGHFDNGPNTTENIHSQSELSSSSVSTDVMSSSSDIFHRQNFNVIPQDIKQHSESPSLQTDVICDHDCVQNINSSSGADENLQLTSTLELPSDVIGCQVQTEPGSSCTDSQTPNVDPVLDITNMQADPKSEEIDLCLDNVNRTVEEESVLNICELNQSSCSKDVGETCEINVDDEQMRSEQNSTQQNEEENTVSITNLLEGEKSDGPELQSETENTECGGDSEVDPHIQVGVAVDTTGNSSSESIDKLQEKHTELKSQTMKDVEMYAACDDVKDNDTEEEEDDEDSWDKMFDEEGECLDPKAMEELTAAIGKVKIKKPTINYLNYQPRDPDMDYDEMSHVIEIFDFPPEFKTEDLITAFHHFSAKGFDIKWVDDTHALGVFNSPIAAKDALALTHPLLKVGPLSNASRQCKLKAKRCVEFLQPYKPRPETSAVTARRLVTGALGLAPRVSKEQRDAERQKLKQAREKKKLMKKQKDDIWEGTYKSSENTD